MEDHHFSFRSLQRLLWKLLKCLILGTAGITGVAGVAEAHVLPAGQGSLHLKGSQVYLVLAVPLSVVPEADRNGDGALIGVGKDERLLVTKKQGNFLLATNFDVGNPTVNADEPRYKLATELWQKKPEVSLANFRSILAAIHFEANPVTLYSNIYDLKRGTMMLYQFHNYVDAVKIDLKQELAKGERSVKIEELFPYELKAVGHTLRINAILKCVVRTKGDLEKCLVENPGGL